MKVIFPLIALLGLSLVAAPTAHAVPFVASEIIEDLPPYDFIQRDLQRTRTSDGFSEMQSNDATIVSDNLVDSDFGFYNNGDVSYRHALNWIIPGAGTFLSATLEISAFGPDFGDDQVTTETINLGALSNDGQFILDGFTTTIFNSFTPVQLSLLLTDGFLNVTVNKNSGGGLADLDLLSVYKSKLTVTYDAVPEPATLLLLGSAGLLGAVRRRKNA